MPRGGLFKNVGKVKPRKMPISGKVGENIKQKIRRKTRAYGYIGFGKH